MRNLYSIFFFFILIACQQEEKIGLKELSGDISGKVITFNNSGDTNLSHSDVSVRIKHMATSDEYSAISDEDGIYILKDIPMGEYEIFYTKENYSKNYIYNYKHLGGTQTEYINDVPLSVMVSGAIEIKNITYVNSDRAKKIKVDLEIDNITEDTSKYFAVVFGFSYQPEMKLNIKINDYGYSGFLYIDNKVPCKKNYTVYINEWYVLESNGFTYPDTDTTIYCQAYLSNCKLVKYSMGRYPVSTISSVSDSSSVKSFWLFYESPY